MTEQLRNWDDLFADEMTISPLIHLFNNPNGTRNWIRSRKEQILHYELKIKTIDSRCFDFLLELLSKNDGPNFEFEIQRFETESGQKFTKDELLISSIGVAGLFAKLSLEDKEQGQKFKSAFRWMKKNLN